MKGKIVVLLSVMTLLNGCLPAVNLQDRAIVQGVGIDYENGEYLVTMQVFSSDGSGGQVLIDSSRQNAKVITCRGETVAQAVAETAISQGKSFFLGHNRLLILGKGTRQLPLKELLTYFYSTWDTRWDVSVLAARETAAQVLEADINQGILPALTIEKTVENAADSGKISPMSLLRLRRELTEREGSVAIPILTVVDGEDEKQLKSIAFDGMAVYGNNRWQGELAGKEIQGLLLLRNEMEKTVLSLPGDGEATLAAELSHIRTSTHIDEAEGRLTLHAAITADGRVVERWALVDGKQRLEQQAAEQLQLACESAFAAASAYGSDLLGLKERLRWRQAEESAVEIRLEVTATVQLRETA